MNFNNKGIIILNLGSPDSYEVKDVKNYLREFLMDGKVIDIPKIIRSIIVKGFIVPFRSPKSAHAYKSIWTKQGSPLKVITNQFVNALQKKVNIPITVCMRYGNPNPESAYLDLLNRVDNLQEILIAPMYPHYAMSSYETALEHVVNYLKSKNENIKIKVLKPFYNEPNYIKSLAQTIEPHLAKNNFDGYLFSYHGIPIRHLKKSDATNNHCYANKNCCEVKSNAWQTCYKHQVTETTNLVVKELNLDKQKVHQTFQSRLGSDKWIQPFTDKMLEELPQKGVKKLLVLCPAFVADCLETLEEMDDRGKHTFIQNGGVEFERVPCLNTSDTWINTFANYCNYHQNDYKHLWS